MFSSFVAEALSSGKWAILVAELESRLVGNVYVQLVRRVPVPSDDPEHWTYITNVYVEPEYRDRGFGGELLAAGVAWARSQGSIEIRLWPSTASVPFYRRAGFAPGEAPFEWDRVSRQSVTMT